MRTRRSAIVSALLALWAPAAPAPALALARSARLAPDPTGGGAVAGAPVSLRLSDEVRRTVWDHPAYAAILRAAPSVTGARTGRLRLTTEDGFPEVLPALRAARDAGGRWWLRVRVPGRPRARAGWVPREALGFLRVVDVLLVVDRRRRRLTLERDGRPAWHAPAGIGARATPTPAGRFWVREGFPVAGAPVYGAYAVGTSAYSVLTDWPGGGVVGIHGTDRPELIPGRPSHGCIRLRARALRRLARELPLGAPVRIR